MMGLPYILGDKDPKDPMKGWDKTWAYLKELGQNIEYYPAGTGATMKELGEGSRDMIASHDRLGHQPARARRRAEGSQGRHAQGLPLGHRRALHVHPEGRVGRQARRAARPDELSAHQGSAGLHLRRGLFLSRPGGEGRAARHGAGGKPGGHQGVRPARIREADRRATRRSCRCCRTSWSSVPAAGTSRSARRRRSKPTASGDTSPIAVTVADDQSWLCRTRFPRAAARRHRAAISAPLNALQATSR